MITLGLYLIDVFNPEVNVVKLAYLGAVFFDFMYSSLLHEYLTRKK